MAKLIGGMVGSGIGALASEKPLKKATKVSTQVADKQFQYNMDAANAAANINRYNETNPYGAVNWTKDPTTGQWTVNQTATPQLQGAIDSSLNTQTAGNKATQGAINRVAGTIGKPFDTSRLPAYGATPYADAALRNLPASSVPVSSAPNAGPVQTGLGNTGNPFSAVFGSGAVPDPMNVYGGQYQGSIGQQGTIQDGLGEQGSIRGTASPSGPIQSGVGLQTSLGNAGAINRGINDAGPIQSGVGLRTGINDAGPIQSGVGLQTSLGNAGPISGEIGATGQIQRGVDLSGNSPSLQSYQRGLDFSGAPALYGSGNVSADYNSSVNTAFGAQKANIDEAYSTERTRLIQQLADQGIPMDSEAARFQIAQIDKNRDAAYIQAQAAAANTGLNTQSTLSGLSLANRGQMVGETQAQGGFANDATGRSMSDAFSKAGMDTGNSLAAAQYGLQAQGQEFGQAAARNSAANQAQQQQFGQLLQSGAFGNDAMLAAAQYGLQAQGQQYGQNADQARFGNDAQQQQFEQMIRSGMFGNDAMLAAAQYGLQAQNQQYGQNASDVDRWNAAQQQGYNQSLGMGQFANQAQQQGYEQAMGQAGLYNQAMGQGFDNSLAASGQNYGQAANTQSTRYGQLAGAQQQAYSQALGSGQFYNAGQGQRFDQGLAGANFANQAQQQQFGQYIDRGNFYNQGTQQNYDNALASAQQQNALRGQEFGIAADARAIPVNETLGFMKALQPTPQLPQVQTPAINVDSPNYLGFMNNELATQRKQKAGKIGAAGDIGSTVGGMICWVAREVYGENNPAWLEFRQWMLLSAPKWLLALYTRHGERLARFISNKPRLKSVIRFIMDRVR